MPNPNSNNKDDSSASDSDGSDIPRKRLKQHPKNDTPIFLTNLSVDDDNDAELSDEGDLSDSGVEASFTVPYLLQSEISVSCSNTYIIHICGTRSVDSKLAVALSDYTCSIYDVDSLSKCTSFKGHKATISNIRFSPSSEHLLYTSSLDGFLKLWDLRTKNACVKEFKDNTDGDERLKELTSFDVSHNDHYLCAGTELIGGDAFLLYWDVRTKGLLGGYWESHTDDITQVTFHPTHQNTVATGSTDGLINVFDISMQSEDDALQHSLNTESSVDRIGWFSCGGNVNTLSCITHTEHLQLWERDGAAPYLHISREKLTHLLHRNPSDNSYLVNVHCMRDSENLMVVAGSAAGNGHCLRTLRIDNAHLTPMSDLHGNRQIVRASWLSLMNDVIVTGGESGFLNVWKPGKTDNIPVTHKRS